MTTPSAEILEKLVGFPSVCGKPNKDIVDFVSSFLSGHGIPYKRIPGPEGDRENIFATIGPADVPGYILSGHLDVVPPGDGWHQDPFRLTRSGNTLVARGAVDMKGFDACVLALVPRLGAARLERPIHIAFSYDEELGCVGVQHLLPQIGSLCAPPLGCIVGEPSCMIPVLGHKGKIAMEVAITGKPAHSSRPELGENAIHAAVELMTAMIEHANALKDLGEQDASFEPPHTTLQIGTITGGTNVNVVPEHCVLKMEARCIRAIDPMSAIEPILATVAGMNAKARQAEQALTVTASIISRHPGLQLDKSTPLARFVTDLAGSPSLPAVSFGTEAGLSQRAGIAAIICGPGDVAQAHTANEYIAIDQLSACDAFVDRLASRLTLQ